MFTGAAAFERLSHFKDVGIPAVVQAKDLFSQAMIADGCCRSALPFVEFDGFAFFHDMERVAAVLKDVMKLPTTRMPSRFVLAAQSQLHSSCTSTTNSTGDYSCRSGYNFRGVVASMHNWHRALCAPSDDPDWNGMYDPAYQPQQEALTIGFMCMIACDCNHLSLPASSLSALAKSFAAADASRAALCSTLPWGVVNFTNATDPDAVAALASPLRDQVCKCQV